MNDRRLPGAGAAKGPPQGPLAREGAGAVGGTRSRGLTSAAAAERLASVGPNAIEDERAPAWRQLAAKFWGPVPWMLEAAVALQVLLGRDFEAVVIAALLVFNAAVALAQERRAQDALALLRQHLHVNARVLRDDRWTVIPAEQLVPGDVVHVRAGDLVPADLHWFDGSVTLDQAVLTGESLPVTSGKGQTAYAGSTARQGEASGEVVATGARTYFGRTAELVRTSTAPSHMQRTILAIVERLVILDAVVVALVVAFAVGHRMPLADTAIFGLMLLVASVPVALPTTYTLATAVSSMRLARRGVLVTSLPAVEEAAAVDTLVSDKTGTLTQNVLVLAGIVALATGATSDAVLRAAALASDESTQDPLDLAVLEPARRQGLLDPMPQKQSFLPFDPETRRSEGVYVVDGQPWHAVKGAAGAIGVCCGLDAQAQRDMEAREAELAARGARVLAVAAGPPGAMQVLGLVGLADRPRPDAADLIAQLKTLGVRVRMATGDSLETARAMGALLGLGTRAWQAGDAEPGHIEDYDLFARVLPEEKHAIVQALQHDGHVVGMTGDGVNDAPALHQAELGVAVASATDVAKAAAGVVLAEPGLAGVLAVVRTGREVHRRMLTYTLNKVLRTFVVIAFIAGGLLLTGRFLISPMLIVLMLFANDFATMSIATDRVRPAGQPQQWHVRRLLVAAAILAVLSTLFAAGLYRWAQGQGLDARQMQTLVFLILVFSNQAGIYLLRNDGPLWAVAPSRWMVAASLGDGMVVSLLAGTGLLMAAVPWSMIAQVIGATLAFTLVLDAVVKPPLFRRLRVA